LEVIFGRNNADISKCACQFYADFGKNPAKPVAHHPLVRSVGDLAMQAESDGCLDALAGIPTSSCSGRIRTLPWPPSATPGFKPGRTH